MKLTTYLANAPYKPNRVLGISKLSSLEFLKSRNPDLSEKQILLRIKKQGKDPEDFLREDRQQTACEKNLAKILQKLDVNFRIIKRMTEASKCVDWADLVMPIGGDGTFLLASKLIKDDKMPVLGINPNVESESNTFPFPLKYSVDIENVFEKLYSGQYKILMRSRIRTVMVGEGLYRQPFHIHEKSRTQGEIRVDGLSPSTHRKIADALQPRSRTLPWLALNEVFMGEFLAARAITLNINIENEDVHKLRSSGICVCTGSGSRSWYKSMNLQSADTIQKVVELATGKKLTSKETHDLMHKYHQTFLYPPDDLRMTFMIREMYRTSRCSKPKYCPERYAVKKIRVKSGGFDAGLVIDGSVSLPFNDGTTASFDIRPEYALRNIIIN